MRLLITSALCVLLWLGGLVVQAFAHTASRLTPRAPTAGPKQRFGPHHRPPGRWRPYAPTSPFNRRLPRKPRVHPHSSAFVRALASEGPMDSIKAIDGSPGGLSEDYSRPFYYAQPGDPIYRVDCTAYGGACPVDGDRLRIPARARPAGGSDGHLTVLDERNRYEWSFFDVQRKRPDGGRLVVGWGRRIGIDGDGRRGGGGAAQFGGMAGRIRFEELMYAVRRRSSLRHALFMNVTCAKPGAFVYPAASGERKDGCRVPHGPEMGRRFYLDMSEREIDRLDVPEWRKVIARTMVRYGAFVGDAGGNWGFQFESGMSYLSFGQSNPFADYARKHPRGITYGNGVYYYNMRDGIPWESRLRALRPPRRRPR